MISDNGRTDNERELSFGRRAGGPEDGPEDDRDRDPLLRVLAAIDPGKDAEGWADSPQSREVYARILARIAEEESRLQRPARSDHERRKRTKVWLLAAATLVILAGASVAVALYRDSEEVALAPPATTVAPETTVAGPATTASTAGATPSTEASSPAVAAEPGTPPVTTGAPLTPHIPDTDVAGTPGTGQTETTAAPVDVRVPASAAHAVPAAAALVLVLTLAEPDGSREEPSSPVYSETVLVQEAVAKGVLSEEEAAEISLYSPVTRRTFALWLWRAMGDLLPAEVATAGFGDLASLGAEERGAVVGLTRAGVVRGRADGTFGGDEVLMHTQANDLLSRVRAALRGSFPH
jgi:hypothetical protein